MGTGNYSVEASVFRGGKLERGTLTLFSDEYVFGNVRKSVNWEDVTCEQGNTTVKAFLRNVEKKYIVFNYNGVKSEAFIVDPQQIGIIISTINSFANDSRAIRVAKEEARQREIADHQQQMEREKRIREEAERKADEEYAKKQEYEKRKEIEEKQYYEEEKKRKIVEKEKRVKQIIEKAESEISEDNIEVSSLSQKAGACIIDNPYRILGISCLASNEEANSALDKLKKLSRLKALDSYKSSFDLSKIDRPSRDLSISQNSLSLLKNKKYKWFWFASNDACKVWDNGKYRIELAKDGFEFGSYDMFLANYLYAIIFDPSFQIPETWKRILNCYCYIMENKNSDFLLSRYNEIERKNINTEELFALFKNEIFIPIHLLCERDDLDALIRIHKYIRECGNPLLNELSRHVVGKLVSWFTEKEADMMSYLRKYDGKKELSVDEKKEIIERGDSYCKVVEPVFGMVLRDFRGDAVRYDMIKESYKNTTYQIMYVLYQCGDKSNAIYFANKCYTYCKPDDKKRIQNTFGEVNIKAVDWNTPHTSWDIKGDELYFGRGCSVDYSQALYWYHKAADAGNMYSKNSIGICYLNGNGVPKNEEQAVSWFKQASESGNPEGAFNLAECYYNGTGVQKNIDQALFYWQHAAKLGHPSAQKKYDEVYSKVQIERKKQRANNHICLDIGFQMTTGPQICVEVSLNYPANVYLVNSQGYQNYLNGGDFSYHGGYSSDLTYRIKIPSSNHWYVIVDSGNEPISTIVATAKVKNM